MPLRSQNVIGPVDVPAYLQRSPRWLSVGVGVARRDVLDAEPTLITVSWHCHPCLDLPPRSTRCSFQEPVLRPPPFRRRSGSNVGSKQEPEECCSLRTECWKKRRRGEWRSRGWVSGSARCTPDGHPEPASERSWLSCGPLCRKNLGLLQDGLHGGVLKVRRVAVLTENAFHQNPHPRRADSRCCQSTEALFFRLLKSSWAMTRSCSLPMTSTALSFLARAS